MLSSALPRRGRPSPIPQVLRPSGWIPTRHTWRQRPGSAGHSPSPPQGSPIIIGLSPGVLEGERDGARGGRTLDPRGRPPTKRSAAGRGTRVCGPQRMSPRWSVRRPGGQRAVLCSLPWLGIASRGTIEVREGLGRAPLDAGPGSAISSSRRGRTGTTRAATLHRGGRRSCAVAPQPAARDSEADVAKRGAFRMRVRRRDTLNHDALIGGSTSPLQASA